VTLLVWLLAIYFATGLLVALTVSASLAWSAASHRRIEGIRSSHRFLPPITLAITADENDADLIDTIHAALAIDRPANEIIVVLDRVNAGHMALLNRHFAFRRDFRAERRELDTASIRAIYVSALHPRLILVDKEPAGTSDALNMAINLGLHPLFAHVPAGLRLHPGTLEKLAAEFAFATDSLAAAVAPVRIVGGAVSSLPWQVAAFESTTASPFASAAGTTPTFVVYRKRMLELAAGFGGSRAPRIDAALRLYQRLRAWGYDNSIVAVPETAGWMSPDSVFGAAPARHAALIDALIRYGGAIMSRGSWSARAAVVYLALYEAAAPFVEALAWVALPAAWLGGWADPASITAIAMMMAGAPLLRAGTAALVSSHRLAIGPDVAVRTFAAVLLSPLLIHPVFTLARLLAIFASRPIKRARTSAPPTVLALPAPDRPAVVLPALPRPAPLAVPPPNPTAPPPLTWAAPPTIHPSETRTATDALKVEPPKHVEGSDS